MKKLALAVFIIFQAISIYVWRDFFFFMAISLFFSCWLIVERKMRMKYEILGMYAFLLVLFYLYSYGENPNDAYKNHPEVFSGEYTLSDASGLNRSNDSLYKENKYILYDEKSMQKLLVNCSLLLKQCNAGNHVGSRVFVEYIRYCKNTACTNYVYSFKSDDYEFNDGYFIGKYEAESVKVFQFWFLYLVVNGALLVVYIGSQRLLFRKV